MTKFMQSSIFAILLALTCTSNVIAATVTYTDFYDAGPAGYYGIKLGGTGWSSTDSDSWTFDITDDGYDPLTESITAATISLHLHDDKDGHHGYSLEYAQLTAGSTVFDTWEVDTGTEVFTLSSLTTLSNTGMLSMTLEAVSGDFYFKDSTLTATAVSAVPVPAAAWLFGSGLLSLAGFARARQKA